MINNSFFSIFLLAHLVGDYVLQTDKIAKEKASSIKGVFNHSIIVLSVQVLFLGVFGMKGIISGFISGFFHFFIDCIKLYINKKGLLKNKQALYFFIDQAIHVIIILLLTKSLGKGLGENYFEYSYYFKYSISIITLAYVSTIVSKIIVFDLDLIAKDKGFFMKNERISDGSVAIIIWVIINFIQEKLFVSLLIFILLYIYLGLGKKYFKYPTKIYLIKYSVYCIVSLILLIL